LCPVEFDTEDIHETMILKETIIKVERHIDAMALGRMAV